MTIDFLHPALILFTATLGAVCYTTISPSLNCLVTSLVPTVYGLWNYKSLRPSSWEILIARLCQVEAVKIGWKICCGLPLYIFLSLYVSYLSFLFVNCQFIIVCEPAGSIPRVWFRRLSALSFLVCTFKFYISVGVKMWFWLRFLVTLKCCE